MSMEQRGGLRVRGLPVDAAAWREQLDTLARWLGRPPPRRPLELCLEGPPLGEGADLPRVALQGGPVEVGLAASRLARARDARRRVLLVRASGTVPGPLLALALSADVLIVSSGMAGGLLAWQDGALPLPGDLQAIGRRLGHARALEVALLGRPVTAAELVETGVALTGEAGETAWREARRASSVAQVAAVTLLARRETGRAAAEALERATFALCFAASDREEGVRAFFEKREPRFQAPPAPNGRGDDPGEQPGEDPA